MSDRTLVLYQNEVYTDTPSCPFMGCDVLSRMLNQSFRDEHIYERLFNRDGAPKVFPKASLKDKLLVYDWDETEFRNYYLAMMKQSEHLLALSRKVIVDDRYPVYYSYTRKFKRWTAKRKTEEMLGNYQLTFGRRCLVDMITMFRYEQAMPEIREILLHEDDNRMKLSAKSALHTFSPEVVTPVLSELLTVTKSPYWLESYLDAAKSVPSAELVKPLTQCFEENYFHYPEDSFEIEYGVTLQEKILQACGRIPTVSSLWLIEQAVDHPYPHVGRQALKQLPEWIENTSWHIGRSKENNTVLSNSILKVRKKYGIEKDKFQFRFLAKKLKIFDRRIY